MYKMRYKGNMEKEWSPIGIAHVETYVEALVIAVGRLRSHLKSEQVTLSPIERRIKAVWVGEVFVGRLKTFIVKG